MKNNNINIFLSRKTWSRPINSLELKHHVYDLYNETFKEYEKSFYPKEEEITYLKGLYRYFFKAYFSNMNILCPDYPILLGLFTSIFRIKPINIMHTWIIPFYSKKTFFHMLFNIVLYFVFIRSIAIIVASKNQLFLLEKMKIKKPIFFSPVSVDTNFWYPDYDNKVLENYSLIKEKYILTVGGNDRDELYAAKVSKILNLKYVRCGYDKQILDDAFDLLVKNNLEQNSIFIYSPSHEDLRVLYSCSSILCLPTIVNTNPAGLSSLVEGMACSSIVALPKLISEGYVVDEKNGLVLEDDYELFAKKYQNLSDKHSSIKKNARTFAMENLNINKVSEDLYQELKLKGIIK